MKTISGRDIELIEISKYEFYIHCTDGSITEITPDSETELNGITYYKDNVCTFI